MVVLWLYGRGERQAIIDDWAGRTAHHMYAPVGALIAVKHILYAKRRFGLLWHDEGA